LKIAQEGGAEYVLAVLNKYMEDSSLVRRCASCIASLANEYENSQLIIRRRGRELLFGAMRAHPSDPTLLAHCCLAIGKLASYLEFMAGLDERQVELVVRPLAHFSGDLLLAQRACYALRSLHIIVTDASLTKEVVGLVLRVSGEHPLHPDIQKQALNALAYIATDDVGRQEANMQEAVKRVVDAMRRFPYHRKLLEICAILLAALTKDRRGRQLIVDEKAVKLLIKQMEAHPHAAAFLTWAAHALGSIAAHHILVLGGWEKGRNRAVMALVRAMDAHPHHVCLLEECMYAFAYIAKDKETAELAVGEGVVDRIFSGMRDHPMERRLQKMGCGAIQALLSAYPLASQQLTAADLHTLEHVHSQYLYRKGIRKAVEDVLQVLDFAKKTNPTNATDKGKEKEPEEPDDTRDQTKKKKAIKRKGKKRKTKATASQQHAMEENDKPNKNK
jgi:hypothetical protein